MTERDEKQPTSEASAPGVNDRGECSDAGCDGSCARPPGTPPNRRERRLLYNAEHAVRQGFEGVCVKGPTLKMAHRLKDAGLLRYVGHAYEEDGNPDRDWLSYAITDAGRAWLSGADLARPTAVQPADSAADATAPRPAGLLKTEVAVAPQERETP